MNAFGDGQADRFNLEAEFELHRAGDEFLAAAEGIRNASGTTMEIDRAVETYLAARRHVRSLARQAAGLSAPDAPAARRVES